MRLVWKTFKATVIYLVLMKWSDINTSLFKVTLRATPGCLSRSLARKRICTSVHLYELAFILAGLMAVVYAGRWGRDGWGNIVIYVESWEVWCGHREVQGVGYYTQWSLWLRMAWYVLMVALMRQTTSIIFASQLFEATHILKPLTSWNYLLHNGISVDIR